MSRLGAVLLAGLLVPSWAGAWPGRDNSARAKFQRENPCPVNGNKAGACKGWQIDHITPLKCGGTDTPANMQWLTVERHKAKTKAEAKDCRGLRDH